MKNYLTIAGIIFLLSASYGIINFAGSYGASVQPSSFRSFAVSAEGKQVSIPNVAEFSFSVITEGGKDIRDLSDKNNTKSDDIIKFLKGSGINNQDIKTTSYSIEPRTQYYSCVTGAAGGPAAVCPPSEIVGYTISQSAEVKVRDFSKIGDVLNGVVARGANNVSSLQFTTDDPSKIEDLARADAIKKAIEKAKGIASAGGFGLGRLLSIEESNYPVPLPYEALGGGIRALSVAAPVAPIEPGSQETKIDVTLRYEIK